MIGWEDVYKVVEAMVPLYFALMLGYGSVKFWKIIAPEECAAVNRFVCYFTLPLFTIEFTTQVDPFKLNYRLIGADAISKLIIVFVLAFWAMSARTDLEEGHGRPSFWHLMKIVWPKMAKNPNSYACILGLAWAFLAHRWHLKMPSIIEGSILIMSRAGTGTAMFSMGIFMALQEKLIACGPKLTVFGMVLKFIAGPAAMAIGSIAAGLRGDVLRVSIIQAALPEAITSFIFAKDNGLHADVLSTAVIFGTIVSLPLLIAYYAILDIVH